MYVLVTGGAGYIGSHAVRKLIDEGFNVIIIDNLSNGSLEAVHKKAKFFKIDVRDQKSLSKVFRDHHIDIVMHFAGKLIVPESNINPMMYYDNNVVGTYTLLSVMKDYNIKKIVFSSTAAVYGLLDKGNEVIYETDPTNPSNPYGQTKLATEEMIKWYSKAYNMDYIIFRYFNVAGSKKIGINPKFQTALIPRLCSVAKGYTDSFKVFGNDYNTKDGTCIRDYIHVEDLVDAHILAVKKILANTHVNGIYNLGNGLGFSVLEIYKKSVKVTGINIPIELSHRRDGDPIISVASSKKAKELLGWTPNYTDIEDIIRSSWINYYGINDVIETDYYKEG